MQPTIILQGITLDQFLDLVTERIQQAQNGKATIVSKAEVARQLNMNIRTVDRAIDQLYLNEPLTNKDIEKIRKEFKKNKRN